MAVPPSEQAGDWYQIVGPSIGITMLSILAFIASYFNKQKTSEAPEAASVGPSVAKAVGAAFVDEATQAAVLRIDANVAEMARSAREREEREERDEVAERAAERAAELAAKKAAEEIERRLGRKDRP